MFTPAQIHVSWISDPATSLAITWQTFAASLPASAEIRAKSGETRRLTAAVERSPGSGWLHKVNITGLTPATDYEYRVSGGGEKEEWSELYSVRTAPAGSSEFTFGFFCDTGLIGRLDGNATGTAQIYQEMIRDRSLFVIGCGDYAYANRDFRFSRTSDAIDAWFNQAQDLIARQPFLSQYGNHEIVLNECFEDWAPRFAHPPGFDGGRCFSFEVGAVHFASMFVPNGPAAPKHLDWLDRDLQIARLRGCEWLIVFQHEPVFGFGRSHPSYPEVTAQIAPIVERHRVDLHLSGHDQNYERTFPLKTAAKNPTPVSTDLRRYAHGAGVIYAKVSPSGKKSEIGDNFSKFTVPQQPFMAVREDTAHHYALVHVRGNQALELECFSLAGDGSPKRLLESFVIEKP